MELLLLCIPEGSSEVDYLFVLAVLGDGERGRRWRALRVEVVFHLGPLDPGQHNGFPEQEVPLMSFSWGGDPSREVLVEVEEEEAKADDDDVVSVPMVLAVMAAEVVDMLLGRCGS